MEESLPYLKSGGRFGTDYSMIFAKTDWTKGADGKWRFEIPDRAKDMNPKKLIAINKKTGENNFGKKFHLDEIYNNPELYAAYPELRDILVFAEDFNGDDTGGATHIDDDENIEISINYDSILNSYRDYRNPKKTLVHEIQHAIQEIEEFARGSNPTDVKEDLREGLKQAKVALSKTPKDTADYKRLQRNISKLESAVNSTDDEDNLGVVGKLK